MGQNYAPSLTIQLDTYSKKQIKKIQDISYNAGIVATLASTMDIMTILSKKPLKTVKKIYKKDWDTFIRRIKAMNGISRQRIFFIALYTSQHYRALSGDNNWKLYKFWDGVAYAFDK